MLHGRPASGLIRDDLRRYIPHLEYREFTKCGHSPWLERRAKKDFFKSINVWIASQFARQLDDAAG
jgi:pimeloyl-ACP methyl ester carboxylesterase